MPTPILPPTFPPIALSFRPSFSLSLSPRASTFYPRFILVVEQTRSARTNTRTRRRSNGDVGSQVVASCPSSLRLAASGLPVDRLSRLIDRWYEYELYLFLSLYIFFRRENTFVNICIIILGSKSLVIRISNRLLEMFSNNSCWFNYLCWFNIKFIKIYINFSQLLFISFPIYLFFENCLFRFDSRGDATRKISGPSMSTIYNRSHNLIE